MVADRTADRVARNGAVVERASTGATAGPRPARIAYHQAVVQCGAEDTAAPAVIAVSRVAENYAIVKGRKPAGCSATKKTRRLAGEHTVVQDAGFCSPTRTRRNV